MKKLSEFDLAELQAEIARRQVPNLEDEFRKVAETVRQKFASHMDVVNYELTEMVNISEETGIPFDLRFNGSVIYYSPSTFNNKWNKISSLLVTELCGLDVTESEYEQSNWQSSQKCW